AASRNRTESVGRPPPHAHVCVCTHPNSLSSTPSFFFFFFFFFFLSPPARSVLFKCPDSPLFLRLLLSASANQSPRLGRDSAPLLLAASSPAMAFQSPVSSPFDCLLIDLDDTLYPGNTGIGPALRRNIDEFLVARFGLAADKAAALRADLFRSHGSTLAGLIVRFVSSNSNSHAHSNFAFSFSFLVFLLRVCQLAQALGHDVHPDEYHSYVHGRLPYDVIAADPQLAAALQSMPQRKILFTNSDRAHMKRALERLGVDEACFDGVVCFETMNPHLFG
uniref:Pyrimidine 5'-nucleotidase n=1 Tax=Aegilops tauschii subsp. strangulata TaxID=200361 RepID=A0A453H5F2_AEGTS